MNPIVAFYGGRAADYLGRTLDQILGWDDHALEAHHDFIQVLFPNFERSPVTPRAPLLTAEVCDVFRQDESLRHNLARAFDRMLAFYGFVRNPDTGDITRGPDFPERAENWVTPFNHNHLRITRILKCLVALGLPDRPAAFLHALEAVHREHPRAIGETTLAYWRDGAKPA